MKSAAVMPMQNLSTSTLKDIYSSMIDLVDAMFMMVYRQTRKNSRRMTRLAVALLPLMMLLVGSCKTAQTTAANGVYSPSQEFRQALFPDHTATPAGDYHPAQGYVSSARAYIEAAPEKLNNLTQQEIGYLFGKPNFHRRDADAEIWQYKSGYCVVDFYFYNNKPAKDDETVTGGDAPIPKNTTAVSYVDFRMKTDLIAGSAPRTDLPSLREQSKCLAEVAA
jgi:hypothetical protein